MTTQDNTSGKADETADDKWRVEVIDSKSGLLHSSRTYDDEQSARNARGIKSAELSSSLQSRSLYARVAAPTKKEDTPSFTTRCIVLSHDGKIAYRGNGYAGVEECRRLVEAILLCGGKAATFCEIDHDTKESA